MTAMRWDPYILAGGDDFDLFWKDHLRDRRREILFLLGRGFDPRALKAIRRIRRLGSLPKVWLLVFEDGEEESPRRKEWTIKNRKELAALVGEENIVELPVSIAVTGQANATSRNTRSAMSNEGITATVNDVVIDISAMPRVVALSAIAKLIHDLDESEKSTNLHVVAAESVRTDLAARGT